MYVYVLYFISKVSGCNDGKDEKDSAKRYYVHKNCKCRNSFWPIIGALLKNTEWAKPASESINKRHRNELEKQSTITLLDRKSSHQKAIGQRENFQEMLFITATKYVAHQHGSMNKD